MIFEAVLLGEPTPVVSWYINGKKLEECQNIKIHSEKNTYTVTIKDITCDYSGKVNYLAFENCHSSVSYKTITKKKKFKVFIRKKVVI